MADVLEENIGGDFEMQNTREKEEGEEDATQDTPVNDSLVSLDENTPTTQPVTTVNNQTTLIKMPQLHNLHNLHKVEAHIARNSGHLSPRLLGI